MSIHFRPNENFTRVVELTPALRREIEATVERLISILDLFDGDENLEESDTDEDGGDEEPSLGWSDMQARYDAYGAGDLHNIALGYDREEENEHGGDILDEPHDDYDQDLEDGGDDEPSLGWA